MRVITNGTNIPANEMPIEPRAIAHPRPSTNHFESAMFTTSGPTSDMPSPTPNACSTMNCHSSVTCEVRNIAAASATVPKSMSGLGPWRSTSGPTMTPDMPLTAFAPAVAMVKAATVQPMSSVTGLRKTLIEAKPAPTATKEPMTPPPTMYQP